jgi:hypothetical protein
MPGAGAVRVKSPSKYLAVSFHHTPCSGHCLSACRPLTLEAGHYSAWSSDLADPSVWALTEGLSLPPVEMALQPLAVRVAPWII